VLARQRSSEAEGNALLAGGAALAALSIGFMPVAYEANRSRKKANKQRPAPGN
jgi:hypothetical protein